MNAREIFAYNLTRYMQMRGKEQADIVNVLDVSASTVSDWVNGKKYPRVDAMQRLADMLGVLMSDLTAESTNPATGHGSGITAQEWKHIELFRAASPELRAAAIAMLEAAEKARIAQGSSEADKEV